jgi:FHS family L-fucose permease-like MFS transporter
VVGTKLILKMAGGISINTNYNNTAQSGNHTVPIIVLTLLFFMWGFITCMNDILIPHFKEVFTLTHFEAMLVQFAFFMAYFIGSLIYFLAGEVAGDPISKIGYKNGIIAGLFVSAFACGLFYLAAQLESYRFFLGALFILGLGFTLLQIAANPYVAILGNPDTASSRLNMSQGFNSLGTTVAPLVGGYLIFDYFAKSAELSGVNAVKVPYIIFGLLFILLATIIKFTNLPTFSTDEKPEKGAGALKFSHLVLGMIAIFMYVGGEVTIGSILISFFEQPNIGGLGKEQADIFLAFYWGGSMIGRFLGAISLSSLAAKRKMVLMPIVSLAVFGLIYFFAYQKSGGTLPFADVMPYLLLVALNYGAFIIGQYIPSRTLAAFAITVMVLLCVTIFGEGKIAMWAVIGIGLFNSVMWSNIFTLAIDGLGKYTSQASSLLIMMILGGALIPPIQGLFAEINIQMSFFVPMLCYAYIAYYGLAGYKVKKRAE